MTEDIVERLRDASCANCGWEDALSDEAADTIERLREDRLLLLVMHYGRDPVGVGELCDTKLDRSGKLLGQVRQRAMITAAEGEG